MKSNGPYRVSITAILLLGLFVIGGCYANKLSVQTVIASPPLPDTAMFILLERAAKTHIYGVKIGEVSYKEGLLTTLFWTYDRIVDSLRSTALQHGANLAKVTKYPRPSARRGGENIAAELYLVHDVQRYNYEDELDWLSHRQLSFDDFKLEGPIRDVPSIGQSKGYYELGTIAKIRCETSWINRTSKDSVALLLHEQGHFDLCEIYCRQYRDWILKGNPPEPFFEKVNKAWMEKRSQYEWQTYHGLDHGRQAEWIAKINHALLLGTGGSEFEVK